MQRELRRLGRPGRRDRHHDAAGRDLPHGQHLEIRRRRGRGGEREERDESAERIKLASPSGCRRSP
ncbi:MAG: hypothetical protein MZW92_29855 [Comamonadaceae bacterium]|nr:hypothetical protein [Comamonadaceae bacterium]